MSQVITKEHIMHEKKKVYFSSGDSTKTLLTHMLHVHLGARMEHMIYL